jgi:hypothetical protein
MTTSLWAQVAPDPATGLIAAAPEAKLLQGEGPKRAGFIRLQFIAVSLGNPKKIKNLF